MTRRRALVVLTALLALLTAATARAEEYAPLDHVGPELTVGEAELRASLTCSGDLRQSGKAPVLLVPGTTLDPDSNFGWNWDRALRAAGRPFCHVALRAKGMADIQDSAEHVVYALRTMYARAGRRVDVVGYSQGGMVPRWALRFWPDTRATVDDLVGLAASNHGTLDSRYACSASCPPSFWQQAAGARFIAALNSRAEAFGGPDYTAIYTHDDEVVTPNQDGSGSTSLHVARANVANVAIQDLCPGHVVDHLGIGSYDAVAYAIALDALDHDGPARLSRIDAGVCSQPFMPGVDPATFAADYARYLSVVGSTAAGSEQVPAEPPLRCYVTASCPASAYPPERPALRLTRRCLGGRLRVRVTGDAAAIGHVNFKLDKHLVARDTAAPFESILGATALAHTRARHLRAVAYVASGSPLRVVLSRSLPRCGRR